MLLQVSLPSLRSTPPLGLQRLVCVRSSRGVGEAKSGPFRSVSWPYLSIRGLSVAASGHLYALTNEKPRVYGVLDKKKRKKTKNMA